MPRPRFLFPLHSGNLYGTERMALNLAQGLSDTFDATLLAPPGPAVEEGRRLGVDIRPFGSKRDLLHHFREAIVSSEQLVFMATGVSHSLLMAGLNAVYRRPLLHLHRVPGGTDERLSYGRKRHLNHLPVRFITNSAFSRSRLQAHGVRDDRIVVIENFLDAGRRHAARRPQFTGDGVRRIVVVSRIDPIKRIDVLLDALQRHPDLADLEIRVLGQGELFPQLAARARRDHANVDFAGFQPNVAEEMAAADLLVHLCPEEPFGLAIIEAMASGLPVLVPDAGGAGDLVDDGRTGFRFRANDPDDLGRCLRELRRAPAARLNAIVGAADHLLDTRFSAAARLEDYRQQMLTPLN